MAVPGKSLDLFPPRNPDEHRDGTRSGTGSVLLKGIPAAAAASGVRPALAAPRELWLALHLPNLPFEVLRTAGTVAEPDYRGPLAVVESAGQQQVMACNAAALGAGVTAGMGINAAYALTGRLRIHERQPQAERVLLERLAGWAGRFTPRVSIELPDGLLLEVKGSRKLFGGLSALIEQVLAGAREQGVTPWIALAPTPRAALWFARSGEKVSVTAVHDLPGLLARVPVAALRWPGQVVALLASMGVLAVGDCLRLPRDGLARRVGPERLLELDQATGRSPEVRRDFRPEVRFSGRHDFEDEIGQGDWLLERLHSLLDDLTEFLEARQAGVQSLLLLLLHRDRPPTRQVFRFASLATQREHFAAVLSEQLARMQLQAPVRGVKLRSGRLLMNAPVSKPFFFAVNPHAPEQVSRLLEKLRARLGADAIYRLQAVADHRPEHAWRKLEPWQPCKVIEEDRSGRCRPLWLLADPQPIEQVGSWPVCGGPLEIRRGPERIEGGWWTGRDVARDYYVASTPAGTRLWIYRDRHAPHGWFLHGIFG